MHQPAITGSGVFTPSEIITNDELVAAFNAYADRYNEEHAEAIAAGEVEAKTHSNAEFIFAASGIEQRYVLNKDGVLDPARMFPRFRERSDDEPSLMAEIAVKAAGDALAQAGIEAKDIDAVICAASNMERAYPAMAVEIQQELGIEGGFAFDMNVACSSATFGLQQAADMIRSGSARRVLMVNPEITSGHLEWRDRDCHFIFGDVCTAVVVERAEDAKGPHYDILDTRLLTQFSNNIRNNNGFLRRTRPHGMEDRRDMQFVQEGRKVFKQVVPIVAELMTRHLADNDIAPDQVKRMWLHQANKSMNDLIGKKVMGREPTREEQPNILQDYANTSSAGSIIAFSKYSDDLEDGDLGVICSFGAGYSVGSVIVRRVA
ncbi:beta-ketoacyl-ACP synthase III [Pontivivens ytuae]|uniref:Beta-ketoacyl-ACP synthase III n=1 Tax=Pontivivens ytuae TaxID=2789856 RepID=A0A7S9LTU4_9RHOB|nr:beta-ketoacyl-ACP synthase III [Pontivivens ytuae]QPH55031.1 beta-ketoacyl-ACP synthase III [Pontivivens ytuae]